MDAVQGEPWDWIYACVDYMLNLCVARFSFMERQRCWMHSFRFGIGTNHANTTLSEHGYRVVIRAPFIIAVNRFTFLVQDNFLNLSEVNSSLGFKGWSARGLWIPEAKKPGFCESELWVPLTVVWHYLDHL